mgnify:CR=1 FL=1
MEAVGREGRPLKVAIAGGGVGGLALALALQHRSINCKVYERDADASTRKAGYGLTMQQGGRALDALRDELLGAEGLLARSVGPGLQHFSWVTTCQAPLGTKPGTP